MVDGGSALIPGLTLDLPAGWRSVEADLGEFNLVHKDHPGDTLMMWKDVAAVASDGTTHLVPGVPRTPEGLTAYFAHNHDFVVSKPAATAIAGGLSAITYAIGVSRSARFADAGCPVFPRCADLVTDPAHWGSNVYGIGAPGVTRLYLATIGRGDDIHLFVIALDAPDSDELARFTSLVAPIIASIHLPAVIGDR